MLEARKITINYGPRPAVAGVSLKLEPHEVTAIIGPNGAGKSTLLRALNGALKPAEGEILLDGLPLGSYVRRTIGRRIAVVAQEADLRFPVTVLEFVLGGRYAWASTGAWGWETEHDLEVAYAVLRDTRLEDLSTRLLNELSGGERQRAVLARSAEAVRAQSVKSQMKAAPSSMPSAVSSRTPSMAEASRRNNRTAQIA